MKFKSNMDWTTRIYIGEYKGDDRPLPFAVEKPITAFMISAIKDTICKLVMQWWWYQFLKYIVIIDAE